MDIVKGYGVIIRNTPTDVKNTVVYQELTAIAHGGESAVIDVVRADAQAWPNLENLINSLSDGDRIDMYSIDTLLQGNKQRAVEYYSAIINKGIGLLIFDFNTLHKYQTVLDGNNFVYEDDGVFCVWENEFDGCNMHYDLTYFVRDGNRYRRLNEYQRQTYFTVEQIVLSLEKYGFKILSMQDDYTDSSVTNGTERIVLTAQKGAL